MLVSAQPTCSLRAGYKQQTIEFAVDVVGEILLPALALLAGCLQIEAEARLVVDLDLEIEVLSQVL